MTPIGAVESTLTDLDDAPRQGDEDGPAAWLVFEPAVVSTRSQHRPNPIGLHRVRVLEIDKGRVRVDNLEALNGTPILDIKPVLSPHAADR